MKKLIFIFALFYILFFITCSKGPVYYPGDKNDGSRFKKELPKNIIFLIGDGMGLTQISGASFVNDNFLNLERCSDIGLIKTQSANNYVTESAAAATAFATGEKTNNQFVGVDVNGNPLVTILELLEEKDYATGLITTSFIADATVSAFYAHVDDMYKHEQITSDLMLVDMEFIAGGGQKHLDQRTDGLNLIDTMLSNGYTVYYDYNDVVVEESEKIVLFIAEAKPPSYADGRGDFLPETTRKALKLLKKNKNGFFLVVEGAQIDWACAEFDKDYYLEEMFDFDRAIEVALDFAMQEKNTLVVITGDHETGGLGIPAGDLETHSIEVEFITDEHTGAMVPVFAYGPGSDKFTGIYENNELFDKFKSFYRFND